ncbi:hypothetical protein F4780DRAFT_766241 [Xylariomycetidae sp. FL0641]|nr:hypothetical protein F4780DRAFT_766241 [Xylariomycetidae sp. FL0641]
MELQSTIGFLKDPPEGYLMPSIDVIGGLQEVRQNVQDGLYPNQFAFESDILKIVRRLPEPSFGVCRCGRTEISEDLANLVNSHGVHSTATSASPPSSYRFSGSLRNTVSQQCQTTASPHREYIPLPTS